MTNNAAAGTHWYRTAKPLQRPATRRTGEAITVGGVEFEFMAGEYEIATEQRGLTSVECTRAWLRIVWRDRMMERPRSPNCAHGAVARPVQGAGAGMGSEIGTPKGPA